MDKRNKSRPGLFYGIGMALFFMLQELLTQDNLTTNKIIIILVSSLFGGALAGLLFGLVIGRFATYSNRLLHNITIDTDADETIVFETGANHFKGVEGVGGKLCLTSKRLVFKSHKYNIQNHELSIRLSDIDNVGRYKTLGIVNNGLAVTTKENATEKFTVQQPEEWINQLTEKTGLQQVPL